MPINIISSESDELYNYFDEFLCMLDSNESFIRIRGFGLICSLAKWDKEIRLI